MYWFPTTMFIINNNHNNNEKKKTFDLQHTLHLKQISKCYNIKEHKSSNQQGTVIKVKGSAKNKCFKSFLKTLQ